MALRLRACLQTLIFREIISSREKLERHGSYESFSVSLLLLSLSLSCLWGGTEDEDYDEEAGRPGEIAAEGP